MRRAVPLLFLLLAGCADVPEGPVERPDIYPDRTEPALTLQTFLWAWHTGDLDVLDVTLGAWMHHRLEQQIKENGRKKTSEWYRNGATDLAVEEIEWLDVGEALARVRLVLFSSATPRAELDFVLFRRPDGWVVYGEHLIR